MDFRILGPLEVSAGDGPLRLGGRRQRTVLAVLLLNANRTTPTEQIVDLVWGEDPPPTARRSSQVYVSRLRQVLGIDRIESVEPGYRLLIEDGELDADLFEQAVSTARTAARVDPGRALRSYDEALAMWRGTTLADLVGDSEIAARARPLDEARLAAIEERFDVAIALGRFDETVSGLEECLGDHPYRERFWAQLMIALYRTGRQADALRAFTRARTRLVTDLGIEPSADLRDVEERILNQDPSLVDKSGGVSRPADRVQRNPYKGLHAFTEGDTRDFFGRGRLVDTILDRIDRGNRVVAILGPSGSGKSSVINAGVIPALRRRGADRGPTPTILRMEPGEHPFEALELAIATAGHVASGTLLDVLESGPQGIGEILCGGIDGPTVLVVDQFEDLFTVTDPTVRDQFIEGIARASMCADGDLTLIVALRADFYDRPLGYAALAEPFVRGMVSVTPLSEDEIREVIVEPATGVGVKVEPDLVTLLTGVMLEAPAALPQLQFVLMRLFESRDGSRITMEEYEAEGGIDGILARRAEAAYLALSRAERDVARQVFFRLVTYGTTGAATRRHAPLDEVTALGPSAPAVLDRFGEDRLIGFDRDPVTRLATVALVHEALIRDWGRLQSWIALAQADLQLRDSLDFEVRTWVESGRDRDFLLTGSRLEQYEEWRGRAKLVLTASEAEFLDASEERRDAETHAETVRVEQVQALEESAHRRAIALSVVMSIAAIVAAILAFFAVAQGRTASRNAAEAQQFAAVSEQDRKIARASEARAFASALTHASTASLETDPERSVLLALHAVRVLDAEAQPVDAHTIESLHLATQAAGVRYPAEPGPIVILDGPTGAVGSFDLPLGDLVGLAHALVNRSLSTGECVEFFGTQQCPELPETLSEATASTRMAWEPADPERALAGTSVRVLSPWSETDGVAFAGDLARFTSRTGIGVSIASPSLESADSTLDYDVIGLAQPAWLDDALSERLVSLDAYLDSGETGEQHYPYLLSLMEVGGTLKGIPIAVTPKSLVWYPADAFADAGYAVPTDWQGLMDLTGEMIADGHTPWCLAEASPGGDAWPATDFVEDLVLHEAGPGVYDQWAAGEISFASGEIRSAFERFGDIVFMDNALYGGMTHALVTRFSDGLVPMVSNPPGCWLYHQGAMVLTALPSEAQAYGSIGFFPTPAVHPEHANTMLGSAVFASAVADRPEVRELIRFLASRQFGVAFAQSNDSSFIAANRSFDEGFYGNGTRYELAVVTHRALEDDVFRYDGSALMGIEPEFRRAMFSYLVRGSSDPDSILRILDVAREGGAEPEPPANGE
ncbi:MAG: BTAD domain-containing putative transcriptional regulator [Actinomycetota bacterium]